MPLSTQDSPPADDCNTDGQNPTEGNTNGSGSEQSECRLSFSSISELKFWEFIIDFFEVDKTAPAQEASMELIEWWSQSHSHLRHY